MQSCVGTKYCIGDIVGTYGYEGNSRRGMKAGYVGIPTFLQCGWVEAQHFSEMHVSD